MIKSLDENLVNRYLQEIANSYKIECELTQKANVNIYNFIIIYIILWF